MVYVSLGILWRWNLEKQDCFAVRTKSFALAPYQNTKTETWVEKYHIEIWYWYWGGDVNIQLICHLFESHFHLSTY